MPRFVAGDSTELIINHPVFGSRNLEIKAGSDFNYQRGGQQADDDSGNVTAQGVAIKKINAILWMASMTVVTDGRDGLLDYLQDISSSEDDATITVTHLNGAVYSGDGYPVGDIELNTQSGEISLTVKGGGTFDQIGVQTI